MAVLGYGNKKKFYSMYQKKAVKKSILIYY